MTEDELKKFVIGYLEYLRSRLVELDEHTELREFVCIEIAKLRFAITTGKGD